MLFKLLGMKEQMNFLETGKNPICYSFSSLVPNFKLLDFHEIN